MFQQRLASKHYRMRDLKLAAQRSASGYRQGEKKHGQIMSRARPMAARLKNKPRVAPRVDYEPSSAHGRAVN